VDELSFRPQQQPTSVTAEHVQAGKRSRDANPHQTTTGNEPHSKAKAQATIINQKQLEHARERTIERGKGKAQAEVLDTTASPKDEDDEFDAYYHGGPSDENIGLSIKKFLRSGIYEDRL